jgi:hypothetical protein
MVPPNAEPDYVAAMKALQAAFEDKDLAKQVFADANAVDRQTRQNHFEARIEYVRQMAQRTHATEASIKEYSLQILKWLFLLNAGAMALVLAYVGGKSAGAPLVIGPIIKASAPFMLGCVCVVAAGAFGFFNFTHGFGFQPSSENLHQFLSPDNGKWPRPRMQEKSEDTDAFYKRFGKKMGRSRNIALGFAWLSALLFCLGAILVLRAVAF